MYEAVTIIFALLRLAFALWVGYAAVAILYLSRRAGFELRPVGWAAGLVGAISSAPLACISLIDLLGYDRGFVTYAAGLVATLISLPLFLGIVPGKWLLRARPRVRQPMAQANALLELGRRAPENGERAFEKAFDLYSSALAEAPRSVAATYGCGLAAYELATLSSEEPNFVQLDRAQYWFKRALNLEPTQELRKFIAEIDEYRERLGA